MKRSDKEDYRSFVVARMIRLRRAAYLLCHDWHMADDLVSVTLAKLHRNWSRAQAVEIWTPTCKRSCSAHGLTSCVGRGGASCSPARCRMCRSATRWTSSTARRW